MKRFNAATHPLTQRDIMVDWFRVRLTYASQLQHFSKTAPRQYLLPREWCANYPSNFSYYSIGRHYYFEKEQDALMFTLRWV